MHKGENNAFLTSIISGREYQSSLSNKTVFIICLLYTRSKVKTSVLVTQHARELIMTNTEPPSQLSRIYKEKSLLETLKLHVY